MQIFIILGQQGQVERVNSTVKKGTTKIILGEVHRAMQEGKSEFLDISRVTNRWVAKIQKVTDVYNDTIKYITGK
jgi:hypothetical protein